jgi:acyl carrier protein
MDMMAKQQLRAYIANALASHGDREEFEDGESLFVSGRLDSFTMMNLVMHLEQTFGIDFSDTEFDVALVDSMKEIELLIDSQAGK